MASGGRSGVARAITGEWGASREQMPRAVPARSAARRAQPTIRARASTMSPSQCRPASVRIMSSAVSGPMASR